MPQYRCNKQELETTSETPKNAYRTYSLFFIPFSEGDLRHHSH